MTRFRFVHAADLHLDTPFEGIGRVAPVVADSLRDASLEAWDALVRLAIECEAAFLLLAGDIYDGAQRGVRAQLRFGRGLDQLSSRGIQTFIVHGNHDPLDGWSAVRRWPEGVTIFGSTDVKTVPVMRDGRPLATIHGVSYGQRDVRENLALRFARNSEPGLHIGLLHCNVGASVEHAPYSPCSIEDLRRAGMDYWALGHRHRHEVLSASRPVAVYPGCLQGRSTRPADFGAKGAVVVEADADGIKSMVLTPLDRVRFVRFDLDISALEDVTAIHRLLSRKAEELRREHDGRGLLLRAHLGGRGPSHRDLQRPDAIAGLLRELGRGVEGLQPFVWWEGIRDETRMIQDLDAIRLRGDFSAQVLRLSGVLEGDRERRDTWLFQETEPLRRAGLQRWMSGQDPDDDLALVGAAERLAIDALEEEM
jgi:DNA repair exonuclease SbcCD nuclease subunit